MDTRRRAGYAIVVALVVVVAILIATFAVPTVDSADSSWGDVTNETSEIRTDLGVTNANFYPIPGIATVEYDVALNSIQIASGRRGGVGLSSGTSMVALSATMDNARVAPWWRSHVANGERTTMVVDSRASVPFLPVTVDLPERRTTTETAVADSLSRETVDTVTFGERERVVLDDLAATWGEPTEDRTPAVFALTFRNLHDEPVVVEDLRYRIGLNDVEVGAGPIEDEIRVPANGTATVELTMAIENERMNVWWPSHLRNDERSRAVVGLAGATRTVGLDDRSRFDVPIQNTTVETDLLG